MELRTLQDPEDQAYYDTMTDLVGHPGWKLWLGDVARLVEAVDGINRIADERGLYFAKGQLDILNWVKETSERLEMSHKSTLEVEAALADANEGQE